MKFHKIIYGTYLTTFYTSCSMILIIVIILSTNLRTSIDIFIVAIIKLGLVTVINNFYNMSSNFNELLLIISKGKIEKNYNAIIASNLITD